MEIIRFLLCYFAKEYGGEGLESIVRELTKNNFDLRKTISSLSPEKIIPLIGALISLQNKSPTESVEQDNKLNPISGFANKQALDFINGFYNS